MKSSGKYNIKIRPTILIIFTIVVAIAVFTTLGLQYYFSKKLAIKATIDSVKHISDKTQFKVEQFDQTNYNLISLIEMFPSINEQVEEHTPHKILNKFTKAMSLEKTIYAMYIGYENGDFYEIINLNNEKNLKRKFQAQNNERWLIINLYKKEGKRIEYKQFLDKNLKTTRNFTTQTNYNPLKRPWYIKALKNNTIIKTIPYHFTNLDAMGITYAKRMNQTKDIIGVDVSLNTLNQFLKKQEVMEGSQLYLFDDKGSIISSNIEEKFFFKNLKKILLTSIDKKIQTIEIKQKSYFLLTIPIESKYQEKEYLSIFIPQAKILEPYNEKILFSILVNLALMIIILPLVWYITQLISNPIHELEIENKKIENRKFEDVKLIDTSISELHNLSQSFVSMSQSIKKHEQSQAKLMDSFITLIASAIDAKSEYTGGHCERVPILTLMLSQKVSQEKTGVFKEYQLSSKEEIRELNIAALLHDCGKVTTPEYVVDKATKLETIYNRIHEIRTKFEVVYRDKVIESYERLKNSEDKKSVDLWLSTELEKLQENFNFIANANMGSEFMNEADKQRIIDISKQTWERHFDNTIGISRDEQKRMPKENTHIEHLLADKTFHIIPRNKNTTKNFDKYQFDIKVPNDLYNLGEIYNLTISKGTLTQEERFKINEHIIMSIKMLEELPFPQYLERVPEYAGAHHETLIGTGYPKKLRKENMSIPARIMAIADIFEALTASDRPYKEPKKLSESINILSYMVKDQHIDGDLFKLFLSSGVYLEYAKQYLNPEQIDEVNINKYI